MSILWQEIVYFILFKSNISISIHILSKSRSPTKYFGWGWRFPDMYGIALYCKGTRVVVVVVGLYHSNTTPGYTTLLCSALDCGNFIFSVCRRSACFLISTASVVWTYLEEMPDSKNLPRRNVYIKSFFCYHYRFSGWTIFVFGCSIGLLVYEPLLKKQYIKQWKGLLMAKH